MSMIGMRMEPMDKAPLISLKDSFHIWEIGLGI